MRKRTERGGWGEGGQVRIPAHTKNGATRSVAITVACGSRLDSVLDTTKSTAVHREVRACLSVCVCERTAERCDREYITHDTTVNGQQGVLNCIVLLVFARLVAADARELIDYAVKSSITCARLLIW